MRLNKVSRNESGFVLLLAIFLLLFISLLFTAMFNLLTTDTMIVDNQQKDTRALHLADAGIEEAIYSLRQDENWTPPPMFDIVEFPTGSGNGYVVTKTQDSDIITSAGILSYGTLDEYRRTVQVEVVISGNTPPYAVDVISWEEVYD